MTETLAYFASIISIFRFFFAIVGECFRWLHEVFAIKQPTTITYFTYDDADFATAMFQLRAEQLFLSGNWRGIHWTPMNGVEGAKKNTRNNYVTRSHNGKKSVFMLRVQ